MDVSTIRLGVADKTSQPASQQETDLICTCPHPPGGHQHQPPVSQDSYSVIATAAILPPPPNFLCSEMSSINNVQTVPINKVDQTNYYEYGKYKSFNLSLLQLHVLLHFPAKQEESCLVDRKRRSDLFLTLMELDQELLLKDLWGLSQQQPHTKVMV